MSVEEEVVVVRGLFLCWDSLDAVGLWIFIDDKLVVVESLLKVVLGGAILDIASLWSANAAALAAFLI